MVSRITQTRINVWDCWGMSNLMISLPWAHLHIIYICIYEPLWTFIPPSKNPHQPYGRHSRNFYSVNSLYPMFIFPYTPPLYSFRTNKNSQTTVVKTSEARKLDGETINDKSISCMTTLLKEMHPKTLSKSLFWMGSPQSHWISSRLNVMVRSFQVAHFFFQMNQPDDG